MPLSVARCPQPHRAMSDVGVNDSIGIEPTSWWEAVGAVVDGLAQPRAVQITIVASKEASQFPMTVPAS